MNADATITADKLIAERERIEKVLARALSGQQGAEIALSKLRPMLERSGLVLTLREPFFYERGSIGTESMRFLYERKKSALEKALVEQERLHAEIEYLRHRNVDERHAITVDDIVKESGAARSTVLNWVRQGSCPAPDRDRKIDRRLAERVISEFKNYGRVERWSRYGTDQWHRPDRAREAADYNKLLLEVERLRAELARGRTTRQSPTVVSPASIANIIRNCSPAQKTVRQRERIVATLSSGPKGAQAVADALSLHLRTIQRRLNELCKLGIVEVTLAWPERTYSLRSPTTGGGSNM